MIPSRPLDLGGIINETLRIIKQTYWRAALILLAFWVPGLIFINIGIDGVINESQELVTKFTEVSPDAPVLIRDYIATSGSLNSIYTPLLRFQYRDLFSTIDSVKESINAKYPDTLSRTELKIKIDSIASIIRLGKSSSGSFNNNFIDSEIFLLLGFGLFILGWVGNTASQYDLSSRAFEERVFSFSKIFKLTFSRTLWLLLIQYLLISFAMIFGLSIVFGISFAISPVLAVFGMLIAVAAIFYSGMRIIFSGVILVSEERTPFEAIKRSLNLTEGMFWRILGITIVCYLLFTVVSSFIQLPLNLIISPKMTWLAECIRGNFTNIPAIFQNLHSVTYAWEVILILSALISASFFPAFVTTFYYDLRTRHDGPLEYPEEPAQDNLEPPAFLQGSSTPQ